MMRRRHMLAALGAGLVLLTGCASQAPVRQPLAPRALAPAFELEGRLAASDGKEAASGALLWSHGRGADEWTLFNPLGQIVAQLVSTPRGATLLTADGQTRRAATAAEVLPELLGVPAPLEGLTYWVQALPRSGARVLEVDAAGRPSRISDAGWIIDYAAYDGEQADAAPRRIDAAWGDARIRLIIDKWTPQQ